MNTAPIQEIFSSIQGEGLYVGTRQVFIRFRGCQLHCAYCDTPYARKITGEPGRIEQSAGKKDFTHTKNPLGVEELARHIRRLWSPSTKHVSLTGGEPLIHAEFIRDLSEHIEYPLYLETNSGFPEKARILSRIIAVGACDIKLPEHESTDHYGELLENELETVGIFYEAGVETFVKIVILPQTTRESLGLSIDGIAGISPDIPLVLQPVTSQNKLSAFRMLDLMDLACEKLRYVRVIPQIHKFIGML